MGHNFLVDAVLIVFLSLRIQKEIETGQVAKAGILCKTAPLLFSERGEEFVVQVANLPLRDGGERIDWVEPSVQILVGSEMVRASGAEGINIIDLFLESLHKKGAFGEDINVFGAEVVDVCIELVKSLITTVLDACISEGSESLEQEVA